MRDKYDTSGGLDDPFADDNTDPFASDSFGFDDSDTTLHVDEHADASSGGSFNIDSSIADLRSEKVDMSSVLGINPAFMRAVQDAQKKDGGTYIQSGQRSLFERFNYNIGTLYLSGKQNTISGAWTLRSLLHELGLLLGGAYGFVYGAANSPSPRFRIRLNSILNGSGRFGAYTGNRVGVLGKSHFRSSLALKALRKCLFAALACNPAFGGGAAFISCIWSRNYFTYCILWQLYCLQQAKAHSSTWNWTNN